MPETTTLILRTMSSKTTLRSEKISSAKTTIFELPNELIQKVATFLPEHAAASFSLSCKAALVALGDQYIKNLRNRKPNQERWNRARCRVDHSERRQLLTLLDRDIPDKIFCFYCDLLHKPINILTKTLPPSCQYYLWNRYNDDFPDYTQVQHVMKRHRLGLDPQVALRRLDGRFSQLRTNAKSYDPMPSLQGRIVTLKGSGGKASARLYVKYETRIRLPRRISTQLLSGADNFIQICTHLQRALRTVFECRVIHHHKMEGPCKSCRGLQSCKVCRSEFLCYVDKLPDPMSCMVVTAWMDLGEGRTPNDPVWTSHSYDPHGNHVDAEIRDAKLAFGRGSLMRAFEREGVRSNGGEQDEDLSAEAFPNYAVKKTIKSWLH